MSSLQVLRLWLERKILPESVLRRYMDEIGVSNDDTSIGFTLRRPSRAERAIDDPIREMEGMLVDEYGRSEVHSLSAFHLILLLLFFNLLFYMSILTVSSFKRKQIILFLNIKSCVILDMEFGNG